MQRRLMPGEPGGPRPRLLLTGFGPFPGVPINASAVLVAELTTRLARSHAQVELQSRILPTEWKAAPGDLQQHLKDFRPDVALHFGVASEATGFRLETMAENARNKMADANGYVPRRRTISATAPGQLLATFPSDRIRQNLERLGLPVELSTDAGRYICNATLFRALNLSRRAKGAGMIGFIHIPTALGDAEKARDLQNLDWSRVVLGALAIVETCLAHATGPAEVLV